MQREEREGREREVEEAVAMEMDGNPGHAQMVFCPQQHIQAQTQTQTEQCAVNLHRMPG